jgi:hypothetical protein
MPRVRLNHHCRKPGCEGQPGDTITVSAADADYVVSRGGGVLVETAEEGAPKAATKSAKVAPKRGQETAEDGAAADAEKR